MTARFGYMSTIAAVSRKYPAPFLLGLINSVHSDFLSLSARRGVTCPCGGHIYRLYVMFAVMNAYAEISA